MTITTAVAYLLLIGGLAIIITSCSLLMHVFDSLESDISDKTENQTSETNEIEINKHPVAAAIAAYDKNRDAHERQRSRQDTVTIRVITATGVVALIAALAAVVSSFISHYQLEEMQSSSKDMRIAINAVGKIAQAAQDQATISRARIWIRSVKWPHPESGPGEVSYTVPLLFINYGSTPAVPISMVVKFYLCPDNIVPDPTYQKHISCESDLIWPPNSSADIPTNVIMGEKSVIPRVIAPGQEVTIRKRFYFKNPNNIDVTEFDIFKKSWIYCVIAYKDVFGVARETAYFAQLPGGYIPKEAEQYNYWK